MDDKYILVIVFSTLMSIIECRSNGFLSILTSMSDRRPYYRNPQYWWNREPSTTTPDVTHDNIYDGPISQNFGVVLDSVCRYYQIYQPHRVPDYCYTRNKPSYILNIPPVSTDKPTGPSYFGGLPSVLQAICRYYQIYRPDQKPFYCYTRTNNVSSIFRFLFGFRC